MNFQAAAVGLSVREIFMSMVWLYHDLWRAHVSWITLAWVDALEEGRADFDAVRWLDQLQAAHYRALIFYATFHDGLCTFRTQYIDYCTARDYSGECVTEAHGRTFRRCASPVRASIPAR